MSDVFISHSSKDKDIADTVVNFLEDKGLSCWITPRDIVPGTEWAAAISTAITASKVFLLIYTANSAGSNQVAREVSLAETKPEVFVVPYKTDDTPLKGSFEYYLSGSHFIAADYAKKDYKLEELYNIISGIVGKHIQNITNNTYIDHIHIEKAEEHQEGSSDAGIKSKLPVFIGLASAIIAIVVLILIITSGSSKNTPSDKDSLTQNISVNVEIGTSEDSPAQSEASIPTQTGAPIPTQPETSISTQAETPIPTQLETSIPTQAETPIPTENEEDDENDAKILLMTYINTYGNHFENDNGEYYSMKHSYKSLTIDANKDTERTIENSMIYLLSKYKLPEESDFPLQLGVYNKDLHLHVWLIYNTVSKSYEINAYEDEEAGKSQGIMNVHLKNDFSGKIIEDDIFEFTESGWFSKTEFIKNIEDLLIVLCRGLESDFSDLNGKVSFESLGLKNLITAE